ncbi:hypothetical protein [Streptomyces luteogriseus]|uniref:hypothetical protein n=1 Tax=Streptomyces luteogriseus TaxID=68233 RepID=UPI0038170DB7
MTNDGLLRPDLAAEDLVLFSGALSQAALTTGDSHPGQGRRLLRVSLDRLSSRNTAPLRALGDREYSSHRSGRCSREDAGSRRS